MGLTMSRVLRGIQRRWKQAENNRRISRLAAQIERHAGKDEDERPLVFFNASSRLAWVSLNSSFSLITGWCARLAGAPVAHFVCRAGMQQCQLGVNPDQPLKPPPCEVCVKQSRRLYAGGQVRWFDYQADPKLDAALVNVDLAALEQFVWQELPLGQLVLPSLRWSLRRHHLIDDEGTRHLYRQFIRSAWRVAQEFSSFLEQVHPRGVVVFNGVSFPEATARHIAQRRGLWVVTHEVGLQPFSAFFTRGHATAYPIHIPEDFTLTPAQESRLNQYLEKRLQGNFSMAGIRFWPEMRSLEPELLQRISTYKQVVPVFTNVIFDTSQIHANVMFENMFAWLDQVLEIIRAHPETFFIIRAHPDEDRPGKQSRESVADWVERNQVERLSNALFVAPREYFSSYEFIQRSKFVMVYNSTIGLEAAIMGAAVLCGGKARFTQIPTVFLPDSSAAHRSKAEELLSADKIAIPPEFQRNARNFLYYQLFKTSLPFDDLLTRDITPGFVRFRKGGTGQDFTPQRSASIRALVDGLLFDGDFLREDD
jgi:hypothetical protein